MVLLKGLGLFGPHMEPKLELSSVLDYFIIVRHL